MFQFLLGTLKTSDGEGEGASVGVSIPFRYAENGTCLAHADAFTQFQFLLGTLKTQGETPLRSRLRAFQFLLGTLKTLCMSGGSCRLWSFNSF